MWILIEKSLRVLRLMRGSTPVYTCRAGLGRQPVGPKERQGDGRTPEGAYFICLVKEAGKYGRSLGLSYPNANDAERALEAGRIDRPTYEAILSAQAQRRRPPWGSPLGGEIYLHEGGGGSDWTQGCVAVESADMDVLFPLRDQIGRVVIRP